MGSYRRGEGEGAEERGEDIFPSSVAERLPMRRPREGSEADPHPEADRGGGGGGAPGDGDDGDDADEEDLAADAEDLIRFSSYLARSYLEQQRQRQGAPPQQPLLDDDDEADLRRRTTGPSPTVVERAAEGCCCRLLAGVDLLLGFSLVLYGVAVPFMVLLRGIASDRKAAVPLWAVSISLLLGTALLRSSASRAWASPLAVALCEVGLVVFAAVKWDAVVTYLGGNREALLLSHRFARSLRDRPGARLLICAVLSALAALEICRSLASLRRSRLDRTLPIAGGEEEEEEEEDWARRNAREWERWRDECDPSLRDRSGNYDPDAVRAARGVIGPRSDRQEDAEGSLTEPLIGRRFLRGDGADVESPGREGSFERRHGLDRGRRRGRTGDDNDNERPGREGRGIGGGGFLSGLRFWRRGGDRRSDDDGGGDGCSIGGGSRSSSAAGFAPVEGEVGAEDADSLWPPPPPSLRD